MNALSEISQLRDGRLFTRGKPGGPKVLEGGKWVSAKGVTVADVWEAKPLPPYKVQALKVKGVLPK
ncbi:MAG: hypothetical protein ACYTE8_08680 [Planctomycetota bacterium]